MGDILVVDDENDIRTLISDILLDEGYSTRLAGNSSDAMQELRAETPALVILDIWLKDSKMDGIDILKKIKKEMPEVPVVIISGHGNIEIAVAAIKQGAYDFVEKPFNLNQLLLVIGRAMETSKLRGENLRLKDDTPDVPKAQDIKLIGTASNFKTAAKAALQAFERPAHLVLTGAPGAGRAKLARYVHGHSTLSDAPFEQVNCATHDKKQLFETLFGGQNPSGGATAGLIAACGRGVILLQNIDQLDDMTLKRIAQECTRKPVQKGDMRIICTATKEDGPFLYDLRQWAFVALPPLCERKADIPALAQAFIKELCKIYGYVPRTLSNEAQKHLAAMPWPANLHQLRHTLEKQLMFPAQDAEIGPEAFSVSDQIPTGDTGLSAPSDVLKLPLKEAREAFEREYLTTQLSRFGGNISHTATFIGMERSALHRKLKLLQVDAALAGGHSKKKPE